jgi:hypothetical protein
MPEPIIMKLGTYIMAPEPISMAYFINPAHQPLIARQQLGKNNKRIAARIIFCGIHVISRKVGDQYFPELLVYISFLLKPLPKFQELFGPSIYIYIYIYKTIMYHPKSGL